MSKAIETLVPPAGWAEFRDSAKVIDLLWERLRPWHYSNHGGASIWEDPDPSGRKVYVAFHGDDIVELVLDSGESSFGSLLSELKGRLGLSPTDVTHYRVFLKGQNFLLNVDGQPTRMGFYTTRFVQANNRDGAEILAVDLIRSDKWLSESVLNDRSDPPRIFAEEVDVVAGSEVPDVQAGFAYFPMDGSDA